MASRIKKGLAVLKVPKLHLLPEKIKMKLDQQKYAEVKAKMISSMDCMNRNIDSFKEAALRNKINIEYTNAGDLKSLATPQNIATLHTQCNSCNYIGIPSNKYSFVCTLGGDGHFLKVANYIYDDKLPMVGINVDPQRSEGYLCDFRICRDSTTAQLDCLMLYLSRLNDTICYKLEEYENQNNDNNSNYLSFYHRTRILISLERNNEIIDQRLCLNEMMLEEAFGAKTCAINLTVDNKNLGIIKSSGIIVASGTGSTGLLMSARRPRISEISHYKCAQDQEPLINLFDICKSLSFPCDSKRFYYFNRELCRAFQNPFSLKDESFDSLKEKEEGFCQSKLTIENLNMDGNVLIDGNNALKLEYGDSIHVTISPIGITCLRIK